MNGPSLDDVLWLLDNHFGTEYGDVVRSLRDDVTITVTGVDMVPAWVVKVTRPIGWNRNRSSDWVQAWFRNLGYGNRDGESRSKIYKVHAWALAALAEAKKAGFEASLKEIKIPKTPRANKVAL